MLRSCSHAASAAATHARRARCLVMERNLPRVVGCDRRAREVTRGSGTADAPQSGMREFSYLSHGNPCRPHMAAHTHVYLRDEDCPMTASTMTAPRFPRAAGVAVTTWLALALVAGAPRLPAPPPLPRPPPPILPLPPRTPVARTPVPAPRPRTAPAPPPA